MQSCTSEPFSAELTVLVCEPIIHAVAYCENKAFFKQASQALIHGLLPGSDEEEEEEEEEEIMEYSNDQLGELEESDVDSISANSDEEIEFKSEDYDKINDDLHEDNCCDSNHGDNEEMNNEEPFIFDYSLLSKFIFDFGAREDVLVRNRRFLYDLSQIIDEIATGSCCDEEESCCSQHITS